MLVYAFAPYAKHKHNISEEVLRRLTDRPGLAKVVFPVEFNQELFTDKVKELSPVIIIGLGQHPRGRLLRIERQAVNLKAEHGYDKPRTILPSKSSFLRTNLKLRPDANSRVSYNAGKYVCNFSMYVLLNYALSNSIIFGFIHIPKTFDALEASHFVAAKLDEVN